MLPWIMKLKRVASALAATLPVLLAAGCAADDGMRIVKTAKMGGFAGYTVNEIVAMPDQGFVLAGQRSQRGWASKVDADGRELWRYVEPDYGIDRPHGRISGAVAGENGSVWLCGAPIYPPTRTEFRQPAGLTHIDASGKVLAELRLTPESLSAPSRSFFARCVDWNGGIAVVGEVNMGQPASRTGPSYYWILFMDRQGHKQWEKLVPYHLDDADIFLQAAVANDGGLMITAIYPTENQTEVTHIEPTGKVIAQRTWSGQWRWVHALDTSAASLWISRPGDSTLNTLRTANKQLEPVTFRPLDVGHENRRANFIYANNHSLLAFGGRKSLFGYQKHVLRLDKNGTYQELRIDKPEVIWLDAAVPTKTPGEFLAAGQLNATVSDNRGSGIGLFWIQTQFKK